MRLSRRQLLRNALVFSAGLMLPRFSGAETPWTFPSETLHLLAVGDWGTGDIHQAAVAQAMRDYAARLSIQPAALLMLGDNFYGHLPGVDSPRWQKEFESMYPTTSFPGPCYAVLGNHDYDDQFGGEQIQLDYAKKSGTRWKMPARWYRVDLPLVTLLCTDTHYKKLSDDDIAAQQAWLETELAKPRRTPWLIVVGHHPVFSCGASHGDSPYLQPWRELFYQNKVDAYLCGHEHDLQHLQENGQPTEWLVSGGGGRALYPVKKIPKTVFAEESFGFLHLAIQQAEFRATFVKADAQPMYSFQKKAGGV